MTFICYRMTHDSGFAPNPFFDELTLATCKPAIRRTKIPGDWVAGFVSKALVNNSKNKVRYQGLVYLMRIGEVMTLDEYFKDSRFKKKKPVEDSPDPINRSGDNIYYLVDGEYCQLPNSSHDSDLETIKHDTNGKNVLIADMKESYYFGRNCQIPDRGWESIRFNFSTGRTWIAADGELEIILEFLYQKGYAPGIHGKPCLWDDQEDAAIYGSGCSKQ